MENTRITHYRRVLRHLLFWLAFTVYQPLGEAWGEKDALTFNLQPDIFSIIPVIIGIAYFNLYVLMPRYFYPGKYLPYGAGLLGLLLFNGLMQRFFSYVIWVPIHRWRQPALYLAERHDFWIPVRILRNAFKAFPVIAATMLIKLMQNTITHQKHLLAVQQEKFSAEMGLLKAQIHPHFFFNTLNSVYALTLKGSQQAADVVLRLSAMMHYMLYEARAEQVLLMDEVRHLESYIAIEQVRFADRLDISFQYSGELEGQMIAPMLLIPFVENAFKHGANCRDSYITVTLKVKASQLFLKVENNYITDKSALSGGLGLHKVKRRLELSYPNAHRLLLHRDKGVFEIELNLEL